MRPMRLVLLSLALSACSYSDVVVNPHVQGMGGITGSVVDARSGAPIAGAYVVAVRQEPKVSSRGALTGAEGEFELYNLLPTAWHLMVEKGGYETASTVNLEVTPDQKLVLQVKLQPGDPANGERLEGDFIEPPVFLSGPNPHYTEEALRHNVQGTLVIRCVITSEGEVRECEAKTSLRYLTDTTIAVLQKRKYRPARRNGEPIDVDYTFRINMYVPR